MFFMTPAATPTELRHPLAGGGMSQKYIHHKTNVLQYGKENSIYNIRVQA